MATRALKILVRKARRSRRGAEGGAAVRVAPAGEVREPPPAVAMGPRGVPQSFAVDDLYKLIYLYIVFIKLFAGFVAKPKKRNIKES